MKFVFVGKTCTKLFPQWVVGSEASNNVREPVLSR
jgi:hypothetical protein